MSNFNPHEMKESIETLSKWCAETGVCVTSTSEYGIRIMNPRTWEGITVHSIKEAVDVLKKIDNGDQTMLEF